MSARELVPQVIPAAMTFSPESSAAILEIAYLAIFADHKLSDEELGAFGGIVARLSPKRTVDQVLDDLQDRTAGVDNDERLRELGSTLAPAEREVAYQIAYALGLCDLDSSDEEFEFDLQLVDALELDGDRADELADRVMRLFNPEE